MKLWQKVSTVAVLKAIQKVILERLGLLGKLITINYKF